MRTAELSRTTKETDIYIKINLDGSGVSEIDTGLPFFDHMLILFAKHGKFDLTVKVKGDLEVDAHHSMEDTGLVLGKVIADALGDKAGITRCGSCILPMDETLSMVAVDLSGRPYLVYDVKVPAPYIKDLDTALFHEFFMAFAVKSAMNLHIRMISGAEVHHVFEAIFKGIARALAEAVSIDPRVKGIPSTKGSLA